MRKTALVFVALVAMTGALAISSQATIYSGLFQAEQGGTPHQDTPLGQRSNILQNPGFESGTLAPWTTAGWTVINTDFHSGSYSAQGVTNIWIRQDFAPVDVTTINSISAYEKQPSGIAFAAVDFIYSSDADYDEFLVAPGTGWTFIDMTSQLRGSGMLSAIRFWSYSGAGDQITRVDDVNLDAQGGVPVEASSWGKVKALYR